MTRTKSTGTCAFSVANISSHTGPSPASVWPIFLEQAPSQVTSGPPGRTLQPQALTPISPTPPPPPPRDQAACAADRHRNAVDLVTKARAHPESRRPPALSVGGACAGRCRAARAAGAGAAAGSAPRSRAEPAARSAGQWRSRGAERRPPRSRGAEERRGGRGEAEEKPSRAPPRAGGAAPRSRARCPPVRPPRALLLPTPPPRSPAAIRTRVSRPRPLSLAPATGPRAPSPPVLTPRLGRSSRTPSFRPLGR